MILVYSILLFIVLSLLTGGKPRFFHEHDLRGIFLPVAAFAVEALAPLLNTLLPVPPEQWHWCSIILQYSLLLLFCCLNRHNKAFLPIFMGTVLNFAVISANGFRMPATPIINDIPQLSSYADRIASGELFEYILTDYSAPLWFLGDTIAIPFLGMGLASAGDFLLAGGVGLLIFKLMRPPKNKKAEINQPQPQAHL